ncbi:hypothetical protein PRBEI_2000832900 [Prionailurus iriomotensis]
MGAIIARATIKHTPSLEKEDPRDTRSTVVNRMVSRFGKLSKIIKSRDFILRFFGGMMAARSSEVAVPVSVYKTVSPSKSGPALIHHDAHRSWRCVHTDTV